MALADIEVGRFERHGGLVIHENFTASASEERKLSSSSARGEVDGTLSTSAGDVVYPGDNPQALAQLSDGKSAHRDNWNLDGNFSAPRTSSYDDPFLPSVAPYKRLGVLDEVRSDYSLAIALGSISPVQVSSAASEGLKFYADFEIETDGKSPVALPTPGPETKLIAQHLRPNLAHQLLKDHADNWWYYGESKAKVRLTLELLMPLSSKIEYHARPIISRDFNETHIHPQVRKEVIELIDAGKLPGIRRDSDLVQLIDYFRRFEADDLRSKEKGRALFEKIVSERLGVCRHRAQGFVIVAQALGYPARFVSNEAHAWVEVLRRGSWVGVDLGGAAQHIDDLTQSRPQLGRDLIRAELATVSGEAGPLVDRPRLTAGQSRQGSASRGGHDQESGRLSDASNSGGLAQPNSSKLLMEVAPERALVGEELVIAGSYLNDAGKPCETAVVQIWIQRESLVKMAGQTKVDAQGKFSAKIPLGDPFATGRYELSLRSTGSSECAPAMVR